MIEARPMVRSGPMGERRGVFLFFLSFFSSMHTKGFFSPVLFSLHHPSKGRCTFPLPHSFVVLFSSWLIRYHSIHICVEVIHL